MDNASVNVTRNFIHYLYRSPLGCEVKVVAMGWECSLEMGKKKCTELQCGNHTEVREGDKGKN
jgi:hypothetical protein